MITGVRKNVLGSVIGCAVMVFSSCGDRKPVAVNANNVSKDAIVATLVKGDDSIMSDLSLVTAPENSASALDDAEGCTYSVDAVDPKKECPGLDIDTLDIDVIE